MQLPSPGSSSPAPTRPRIHAQSVDGPNQVLALTQEDKGLFLQWQGRGHYRDSAWLWLRLGAGVPSTPRLWRCRR